MRSSGVRFSSLRLHDQQTVERVGVMHRQARHGDGVRHADGQGAEAAGG